MKSKKIILGLVLSNFIIGSLFISNATSNSPKPANGDWSLGFGNGDEFEFFCTVFDTTELLNVFGGGWQTTLGNMFWFSGYTPPANLGEKTKFAVVNITDISPTTWWFYMDGWSFTAESASYGAPVMDDVTYNWPKNITSGVAWNPTCWLISLPVIQCLSTMVYPGTGYTTYENVVIYSGFGVDYYYCFWIYDENTGVVETFRIRNDSVTIFELNSPVSASSKDGIPGYSLYILISTIILLISFISIILIKKVKWN
ncbi:MAG: hypothetical protein ACFFHD_13750 [Promethearchaeota archaeon]